MYLRLSAYLGWVDRVMFVGNIRFGASPLRSLKGGVVDSGAARMEVHS